MLTDTFVRQVKHKGTETGERYADGGGMYLRVKPRARTGAWTTGSTARRRRWPWASTLPS
ncbi:hypothetical protein J2W35_000619 [Variovorax boronicumulans]|nr:hypothetical protein [Variovorax boronicumulans]